MFSPIRNAEFHVAPHVILYVLKQVPSPFLEFPHVGALAAVPEQAPEENVHPLDGEGIAEDMADVADGEETEALLETTSLEGAAELLTDTSAAEVDEADADNELRLEVALELDVSLVEIMYEVLMVVSLTVGDAPEEKVDSPLLYVELADGIAEASLVACDDELDADDSTRLLGTSAVD